MSLQPKKPLLRVFVITLFLLAPGPNGLQLYYQPSEKTYLYNNYLQGTLERKGETQTIHLQFIRNWRLIRSETGKYLLQEWGNKYQGSDFNFSELGLPKPEERVEKVMDQLGRVYKVANYPAGHRYYLNLLVFPEHPVSLGSGWKYEAQLYFDFFGKSLPANCQLMYQPDKVLTYKNDYHCAKILFWGSCQAGPESNPHLDYRFQGKVFFELTQGREIDYQLSYSWVKSQPELGLKETAKLELYSILEK